jgi:methyl-accepting chemotaxis protein
VALRMNLGAKIGGGFGVVILISIIIGGVAMMSMKRGGTTATILSREYVPEVTIANSIERSTFFMLLKMQNYGYTDDETSLKEATTHIANVKEQIKAAANHGLISSRLSKLKEDAGKAEQSIVEYESLVGETVRFTKELAQQRKAAEDAGSQYLTAGYAFLSSQKEAMEGEIMASIEGDALQKRLNRISLATDIIDLGNRIVADAWKAQSKRDPKLLLEAIAMFGKANEKLDALKKICDFEGDLKRIEECRAAALAYKSASIKLAETMEAREKIAQRQLVLADGVAEQAKHFASVGMEDVIRGAEDAAQTLSRASMVVGVGLVLGLLISIIVAVIIKQGITRPIHSVVQMLKDIAQGEGDLTKRLTIQSKDELGELAHWFNTFVAKLHGIMKNIRDNTGSLVTSAEELVTTSNQMASTAEKMSSRSGAVATAGALLSSNIETMAASSETISASTGSVSAAIEEMSSSITEVSKNCENESRIANQANVQVVQTSEIIDQLGRSANEIGKVVEVISSLADQTNLLALNATIEAARAGDSGKGFAVVANEVKELARQSAQATIQITAQIEQIQANTNSAVVAIGEIARVIEEVSNISSANAEAVEQQSGATDEIARAVSGVSMATHELADNVQESANGASKVSEDIQGVREASNQVAIGAKQTNTSAQSLTKVSTQLKSIVDQFKL